MKKLWLLTFLMFFISVIFVSSFYVDAKYDDSYEPVSLNNELKDQSEKSYFEVEKKWQNEGLRDDISFNSFISHIDFLNPKEVINDSDKGQVLKIDENNFKNSFNLDVLETGLYAINLEYMATTQSVRNIEVSILINDEVQYVESKSIVIPTFYENPKELIKDRYGNDIMPVSKRYETWTNFTLRDTQRLIEDVLLFKLNSGINKITIVRRNGDFLLSKVSVKNKKVLPTYDEYLNNHNANLEKDLIMFEAEEPLYRNSLSIRYGTDREKKLLHFH